MMELENYFLQANLQAIPDFPQKRVIANLLVSLDSYAEDYKKEHPGSTRETIIAALWEAVEKWCEDTGATEVSCAFQISECRDGRLRLYA